MFMERILIKKEKYEGKYVALEDFGKEKIISYGKDPKKVYERAVKKGYYNPVIVFIPKKNMLQKIPFIKLTPNDLPRPWLPVTVINPYTNKEIKIYGLIDTGADECTLPARYASILGHNLEKGFVKEINTGNGKTIAIPIL